MKNRMAAAVFAALLFYVFTFSANTLDAEVKPLKFLIFPHQSATELYKKFTPLADYLSKKTGGPVVIEITRDYPEQIELVGKDQFDLAFMGPAPYVKMTAKYGQKPILGRQELMFSPTFQGIIVVRKDSDAKTIKDLLNKRFAFGDTNSTMAHLVPRYMLYEEGITVDKLGGYQFLATQSDIALGVLTGNFDAGALRETTFHAYEKEGLRELARSEPVAEHLFLASKQLPPETTKALQDGLFGLKDTPEGKAVMAAINKEMTGIVPADDSDYQNLRVMLDKLEKIGVKP